MFVPVMHVRQMRMGMLPAFMPVQMFMVFNLRIMVMIMVHVIMTVKMGVFGYVVVMEVPVFFGHHKHNGKHK